MTEFRALLELLGMLVADGRTGVLLALLALAAWHDSRSFRIPNWLTGGGIVYALLYNAMLPGFVHSPWWWAGAGMLTGFCAMLPWWLLRVMGAGDVKLIAMVGAFTGVPGVLHAIVFSMVAAGLAALLFAALRGVTGAMLGNVKSVAQGLWWSTVAAGRPDMNATRFTSVGRLAYGVSIAVGTSAWLVADQLGFI
ncbi:MAG: prepilin peptidase [Massilia sp.]